MTKTIFDKAFKFVPFILAIAACIALAGCSGASSQSSAAASSGSASASAASSAASTSTASASTSASASASASSASAEVLVFGTQSPTALGIVVKNETGADITDLSAQSTAEGSAPVALMKAGESLPAGKQATVYIEPQPSSVFNFTFLAGGAQRQVHNLDLNRVHEADFRVEGDVAYITATIDGNPVSSLQEEYDIAHPPAQQQSEPEPEPEPEYYYEDNGGGAPAQSEDGCATDIILN